MPWGVAAAAVGAAGSLGSGLLGASAAQGAAKTQAAAAQQSAQEQAAMFQQTTGNLSPWLQTGQAAQQALKVALGLVPANQGTAAQPGKFDIVGLNGAVIFHDASPELVDQISSMNLPYLHVQQTQAPTPAVAGEPNVLQQAGLPGMTFTPTFTPSAADLTFNPVGGTIFQPTQAQLEATPGYQWNLAQGLRGVEDTGAAKGRGISGAALQGAAGWATGLASQTLGQQQQIFQNNLQNQSSVFQQNLANQFYNQGQQQGIFQNNLANIIGPLQALSGQGLTAGTQTATTGAQVGSNIGQAIVGGANALAAGQVGSANALGNAATGIGNAVNTGYNNYLLANALQNQGGGGGNNSPINWG